jgi:SH3-like domain-containing protein
MSRYFWSLLFPILSLPMLMAVLLAVTLTLTPVLTRIMIPDALAASDRREIGETGLPLPRFVTVKSGRANMRRGPGEEYPVIWEFRKAGLPVEIIGEYGDWRQVRDSTGEEGWMKRTLLRGQRGVVTNPSKTAHPMLQKPRKSAFIVAYLQAGVVGRIEQCNRTYCLIEAGPYLGWVARNRLWGVYNFEYKD